MIRSRHFVGISVGIKKTLIAIHTLIERNQPRELGYRRGADLDQRPYPTTSRSQGLNRLAVRIQNLSVFLYG